MNRHPPLSAIMKVKRHFFVCVKKRPAFARPSCALGAGEEILTALREQILAAGLVNEVAVTRTGCLGPCETGPSIVVYPEGVWYRRVQVADVPELVASHARKGEPVARLVDSD